MHLLRLPQFPRPALTEGTAKTTGNGSYYLDQNCVNEYSEVIFLLSVQLNRGIGKSCPN